MCVFFVLLCARTAHGDPPGTRRSRNKVAASESRDGPGWDLIDSKWVEATRVCDYLNCGCWFFFTGSVYEFCLPRENPSAVRALKL